MLRICWWHDICCFKAAAFRPKKNLSPFRSFLIFVVLRGIVYWKSWLDSGHMFYESFRRDGVMVRRSLVREPDWHLVTCFRTTCLSIGGTGSQLVGQWLLERDFNIADRLFWLRWRTLGDRTSTNTHIDRLHGQSGVTACDLLSGCPPTHGINTATSVHARNIFTITLVLVHARPQSCCSPRVLPFQAI